MRLFKYRPWNKFTEDTITTGRIFFPSKAKLNDPAELVHPIRFELSTWDPAFQKARHSIEKSTLILADKFRARWARLEAIGVANEDTEYQRYQNIGDKHLRAVEAVYDSVEVHQALRYYMLNHAEDKALLYDSQEKIVDRLNSKLNALGVLCFAGKGDCPVMWAHYADDHRGIVLIFDVTKNSAMGIPRKIKYATTRPTMTVDNVIETLYTKAKTWAYEAEYRILKKKGDECYPFGEEELVGIILGMHMAQESKQNVRDAILRSRQRIQIYQADAEATTYRIGYKGI